MGEWESNMLEWRRETPDAPGAWLWLCPNWEHPALVIAKRSRFWTGVRWAEELSWTPPLQAEEEGWGLWHGPIPLPKGGE